jgi:hypothetical protein
MRLTCSRFAVTILVLALLAGCSTHGPAAIDVQQHGGMREVMREGRTESRVDLMEIVDPGLIGVGALAGLAGEVTILDGQVWVARADGDDVRMSGPTPMPGDHATLLTVATVQQWQRVECAMEGPVTGEALERLIERSAQAVGVDTDRPFPFVIDGVVEQLEIHCVNGFCPHASGPVPADAKPWRWSADDPLPVRIVGFYAPGAAGVMTHHGTSLHIHALLDAKGRVLTGHIDAVTLRPGASLRLPVAR